VEAALAGLATRPDDVALLSNLGWSRTALADALAAQDSPADAVVPVRAAREQAEAALRKNPLDGGQRRLLIYALNAEGMYLRRLGETAAGVSLHRRALTLAEEAARRDPADHWSRTAVVHAVVSIGWALLDGGEAAAALPHLRRALAQADRLSVEDPLNEYVRLHAASAAYGLGTALLSLHATGPRAVEACAALRGARDAWTALRDQGRLPAWENAELERLKVRFERCPIAG
jgi:tetratricopeptide (TPR) repeat protein